jgi:hypothetical protein
MTRSFHPVNGSAGVGGQSRALLKYVKENSQCEPRPHYPSELVRAHRDAGQRSYCAERCTSARTTLL